MAGDAKKDSEKDPDVVAPEVSSDAVEGAKNPEVVKVELDENGVPVESIPVGTGVTGEIPPPYVHGETDTTPDDNDEE